MKFGIAFALLALALNVQAQTWTWLAGMGTEGATTSVAGALGVEAPGNMPSGRQSFAAFYDETLDSTFVFGGRPSEFTTKRKQWDFGTWFQAVLVTCALCMLFALPMLSTLPMLSALPMTATLS